MQQFGVNKIFVKNKNSQRIYEYIPIKGIFENSYRLEEIKNPPKYIEFYCGRPSILGNLFSHKSGTLAKYKVDKIEKAIQNYKIYQMPLIRKEIEGLKKTLLKNSICLTCFCVPNKCHTFEIANAILYEY